MKAAVHATLAAAIATMIITVYIAVITHTNNLAIRNEVGQLVSDQQRILATNYLLTVNHNLLLKHEKVFNQINQTEAAQNHTLNKINSIHAGLKQLVCTPSAATSKATVKPSWCPMK